MIIQQYDEKLKRWVISGVGRVVARDGQSPLLQTVAKGFKRIGFSVNTGTTINGQGEHIYETVVCAVYSNMWNKQLYDIATTLKKNDVVQFAGWVKEGEFEDRETGEMKPSKECRIEWLLPLNLVAPLVKPETDTNIPTKYTTGEEKDDDYLF